jgi:hypothetical protein
MLYPAHRTSQPCKNLTPVPYRRAFAGLIPGAFDERVLPNL